jgi:SOS response regulatory protein OraA/RecX
LAVSVKTSITRAGEAIIRIGLSDGALFSLNTFYLPSPFQGEDYFFPGRAISPDEKAALYFAAGAYRAERAALRLTARAEQTSAGLSIKLGQRGHETAHADAAVSYLRELNIVDDLRFAGRWVQARIRRSADSPLHLVSGLCRRGIDRGIARRACKTTLDLETEMELLERFIAKKYGALSDKGQDARFLRSQLKREGFSAPALERYWDERFASS